MKHRFPSFSQWKQIFNVLSKREAIILAVAALAGAGSLLALAAAGYLGATQASPAFGGSYTEGMVGQPHLINPLYAASNSVDSAISQLVFDGLMTYDSQGNLVPDLAQSYHASPDGKTYDFQLKKNLVWSDGAPLTADDVVFTIQAIQNPAYKSPLQADWLDVAVQKTGDASVRFVLPSPYHSFLENCAVKILPKHIWQDIAPENAVLSSYNLQPVGSGTFQFKALQQSGNGFISRIDLQSNRRYFRSPSHLAGVSFAFFATADDLAKAAGARTVDGFAVDSFNGNQNAAAKAADGGPLPGSAFSAYYSLIPRYTAVFFNTQDSSLFGNANLRRALSYAVDRNALIQTIAQQTGVESQPADSPLLPGFFGYQDPQSPYPFDAIQAATLLRQAGFKQNQQGQWVKAASRTPAFQFTQYLKQGSTGKQVIQLQLCLERLDPSQKQLIVGDPTGKYTKNTDAAVTFFQQQYLPQYKSTGETGAATRKRLNELCFADAAGGNQLSFTLTTVNQPQLMAAAQALKTQWENLGIQVAIQTASAADISSIIESRTYDALLYGETLGMEPDLYPFWYSDQKTYPGLNLSSYENSAVDKLLLQARTAADSQTARQADEQIQNAILADAPAAFLYDPDYAFWVSSSIKGVEAAKIVDPSKRFITIAQWYTKTKRTWK